MKEKRNFRIRQLLLFV